MLTCFYQRFRQYLNIIRVKLQCKLSWQCKLDSLCVARQSLCKKFQLICGFFHPADPTFRMFVSHFPFLFEKSQTDIELLTGILDISIDYCRCIKLWIYQYISYLAKSPRNIEHRHKRRTWCHFHCSTEINIKLTIMRSI